MRYHFISIKLEKNLNSDNAKYTLLEGKYIYLKKKNLWRTLLQHLIKLKIGILYYPSISIPNIYKNATHVHKKMCIRMYIAILFIIAKNWQ